MTAPQHHKPSVERIGGYLHKVSPLVDETGKVIHYVTSPLMVELRNRDVLQIIVGAAILATPVGLSQEVWDLGAQLPLINTLLLALISIAFIAIFVYFNFYRQHLRQYRGEFLKRIAVIYLASLFFAAVLLTLLGKCPWLGEPLLAVKRVLIVAFPASLSAALSDMVK